MSTFLIVFAVIILLGILVRMDADPWDDIDDDGGLFNDPSP